MTPRSMISFLTACYFAVFLSPQISLVGRGLRTGLPLFILIIAATMLVDTGALIKTLHRLRWLLAFGSIFIAMALLRFSGMNDAAVDIQIRNYCFEPFVTLSGIFLIFLVREMGQKESRILAGWTIVLVCASLTLGVPTLLERTGIARTTMGNALAVTQNMMKYGLQGVGNFGHYSSIGISFMAMVACALQLKGISRLVALATLAGAGIAVLVSTFTMAAVLLTAGVVGVLGYWVIYTPRFAVPRAVISLTALCLIPTAIIAGAGAVPAFKFVYDKGDHLITGMTDKGLAGGDTTGRGSWFVAEMGQFAGNPFLGTIAGVTDLNFGNGHSSLSNTLVAHGLVGSVWWFLTLGWLCREGWRSAHTRPDRYVVVLTWGLLFASGILNPTWYGLSTVGPVVLFTILLPAMLPSREPEPRLMHNPYGMEQAWA